MSINPTYRAGIDIGSTTVKLVILDDGGKILFADYRRHHAHTQETLAQMLHAAKHGLVFHLWWHPHNIGARTDWHLAQLEEIFSYYDTLRKQYGMRSMNMREMADAMETGAD